MGRRRRRGRSKPKTNASRAGTLSGGNNPGAARAAVVAKRSASTAKQQNAGVAQRAQASLASAKSGMSQAQERAGSMPKRPSFANLNRIAKPEGSGGSKGGRMARGGMGRNGRRGQMGIAAQGGGRGRGGGFANRAFGMGREQRGMGMNSQGKNGKGGQRPQQGRGMGMGRMERGGGMGREGMMNQLGRGSRMSQAGAGKGGQRPNPGGPTGFNTRPNTRQPQGRPNPYAGGGGGMTPGTGMQAPQQSANKPKSSFNPSTGRMEYASQPGNFSRSSQRPAKRGRGGIQSQLPAHKGGSRAIPQQMRSMGAMRKNTPTGFKLPSKSIIQK